MRSRRHTPDRRAFLGLAAAAVSLPAIVRAGSDTLARIEGRAFATGWSLTAPGWDDIESLRPGIEAALEAVDRQMSPWRRDSEIDRVNRGAAGAHFVSADTVAVCGAALRLARDSDGHFDPTVGPLVARWGFGPIEGDAIGDWRGLDVATGQVIKAQADTTLDLCGIAKGWALDRVCDLVAAAGIRSALVEIGGELRALGDHPSGRPWQVGVENPVAGGLARHIRLSGNAVATSGMRAQSYAAGDALYGHIIDPVTSAPVRGALRSVSVVASDAMTADGWATALFAAGAEQGEALARRAGLDALFLELKDNRLAERRTGRIAEFLI